MNNAPRPEPAPLPRRALLAGAGAAGAAVVAAKLLPAAPPVAEAAAAPKSVPDTSGGYRLSEHVKRYYATTRA